MRKYSEPELLAPAGNPAAFDAALLAGADAIYLGMGDFNARRNADNFSEEDLRDACRKAHLAGRRVYLTANTLVLDSELSDVRELIARAWDCGIDACIVQDLGLLSYLAHTFPTLELHTSTQMNIDNEEGVMLAARMGASRVTLARELPLSAIGRLASLGVELEVFAHGALCICASGQCLMSSMIGQRSANRGLCAQPCRLPWELVERSGSPSPRAEGFPGDHLLSPKDLCTIDILPELIATGVRSLKIEGRMKSREYVATVVGIYRRALDRAWNDPEHYRAEDDEKSLLAEAFSRGFSTAYLTGIRGNEMMGYQRSNNRGIAIGRILHIADGLVEISCDKDIRRGDILEFWTSRGHHTQEVGELLVGGRMVDRAAAGSPVRLVVDKPVAPGDRVFRVRSAQIGDDTAALLKSGCGVPVSLDVSVCARLGQPLVMKVSDMQGRSGSATGTVCEAARTKALSEADVREQCGRLGGTPYVVASWDVELDGTVGMGFSELHRVRKAAITDYEEGVLAPWTSRDPLEVPQQEAVSAKPEVSQAAAPVSANGASLGERGGCGLIANAPWQVRLGRELGVDVVYAPALAVMEWQQEKETGAGDGGTESQVGMSDLVLIMPTVVPDEEIGALLDLVGHGAGAVADTPALISLLAGRGVPVEAGVRCNALNSLSLDALAGLGATRIWLSPELSLFDLHELAGKSAVPLSITVFGAQELMVTEHCELAAMGPCARQCGSCVRRQAWHGLRDRKGYVFPVTTDLAGRGHIYNSVELDATFLIPELSTCGVNRYVIDGTFLSEDRLRLAVSRAQEACRAASREPSHTASGMPKPPFGKLESTTTGHLYRGVR